MNSESLRLPDQVHDIDPIRTYLRQIGQYPLLTKEDEYSLWEQMQPGLQAKQVLGIEKSELLTDDTADELSQKFGTTHLRELLQDFEQYKDAHDQFVTSNLRLVVSIAKKYIRRMELMDCIQHGNLGLEHAVDKFDASKGFKFSTYASNWIRQAIGRAIDNQGDTIYLPGYIQDRRRKLHAFQEDGCSPEEIEHSTGITLEQQREIRMIDANSGSLIALDAPLTTESTATLNDKVEDEASTLGYDEVEENQMASGVQALLSRANLTPIERTVLAKRFGFDGAEDQTFSAIAKEVGLSRERVRNAYLRALDKMRKSHPFKVFYAELSDTA